MANIDFGGVKEEVVMRNEFPMEKARVGTQERDLSRHRVWRPGPRSISEYAG
jgi:hypothetical protein